MQCPHCLNDFHSTWQYTALQADIDKAWGAGFVQCAACGRLIISLGTMYVGANGRPAPHENSFRLVYPRQSSRPPVPSEVPDEFAADYSEACLVLPDSEKASAALSRRCLQHLLREKTGVKKEDLAKEIQQVLDSKQLPGHVAEDLDAIRHVGNFAAHPMKSTSTGLVLEVEPHEAEWLLNLLEGLFDFYFVQPARRKAKRDALNAKLQDAGKPSMKTP